MAKIIEKSVALGYIKGSEAGIDSDMILNDELRIKYALWSLSEEVVKVIEAGVALGFDFNAK